MRRLHRLARAAVLLGGAMALSIAVPAFGRTGADSWALSTAAPSNHLCSTTGAPEFRLDLTGTWKFTEGDDARWSSPSFDDSGWENRVVPDDWNQTAQSNYDGFAWYRRSFTLPARPAHLTDSA